MTKILNTPLFKQEMGWADIGTAPKDGTEVLVFCPKANDLDNECVSICNAYYGHDKRWFGGGGWFDDGEITHWKPLDTPDNDTVAQLKEMVIEAVSGLEYYADKRTHTIPKTVTQVIEPRPIERDAGKVAQQTLDSIYNIMSEVK